MAHCKCFADRVAEMRASVLAYIAAHPDLTARAVEDGVASDGLARRLAAEVVETLCREGVLVAGYDVAMGRAGVLRLASRLDLGCHPSDGE